MCHLKSHIKGITREIGYPEESHLEIAKEYLAFWNRVDFGSQIGCPLPQKAKKRSPLLCIGNGILSSQKNIVFLMSAQFPARMPSTGKPTRYNISSPLI